MIKPYDIVRVFRWICTVALLCVIWNHTHWSVALALTLGAMEIELLLLVALE